MFENTSQLAVVSVVAEEMEVTVYRRVFVRYSEGTLRRLRSFSTINSDQ
jgi:hypothetical protein